MRSIFTLLFVLGATLWLLGCPGSQGGSVSLGDIGEDTSDVTIHVLPAASASPHTVNIKPPLPVFDPQKNPNGLAFYLQAPQGTPPRWARVEVKDFSMGTPNASCEELTRRNDPDPCLVTFRPEDKGSFKYSIALYEQTLEDAPTGEPDLVIDPVAIIKR